MTNLTTTHYKIDKNYGGTDYVEVARNHDLYTVGQSRAHSGHNPTTIQTEVSTKKELKRLIAYYEKLGYKEVETLHNYQG